MQAQGNVAWQERALVAPDGKQVSYFELSDKTSWVRVIIDDYGTTFALFYFPESDEWERFVMVSPRRQGRLTFYLNRKARRFDYAGEEGTMTFDADLTPADVAMLIQRRFAPSPA